MIVVVADDLSGAAEIAGVGWRFGLRTQVQHQFDPQASVDLVVVNTQTRAMTRQAAIDTSEALACDIARSDVAWCYKKVDSVLRGHVRAELQAMMLVLNKARTVLAPANPSRGRTIVNGRYMISNQPLDNTDFANDPECPVRTSHVSELLGDEGQCPVHVVTHHDCGDCEKGVMVAEAQNEGDLRQWAGHVDDHTLPAGGADFFAIMLERRLGPDRVPCSAGVVPAVGRTLIVCGSASAYSRDKVREAAKSGVPLCAMPELLFRESPTHEALMGQWVQDVQCALQTEGVAIIAVTEPVQQEAALARRLRQQMAHLVQTLTQKTVLHELFIEGGATAEAVLSSLGWSRLDVTGQYEAGIVQMSCLGQGEPKVTIKPGSYAWPDSVLEQWSKGMSHAK